MCVIPFSRADFKRIKVIYITHSYTNSVTTLLALSDVSSSVYIKLWACFAAWFVLWHLKLYTYMYAMIKYIQIFQGQTIFVSNACQRDICLQRKTLTLNIVRVCRFNAHQHSISHIASKTQWRCQVDRIYESYGTRIGMNVNCWSFSVDIHHVRVPPCPFVWSLFLHIVMQLCLIWKSSAVCIPKSPWPRCVTLTVKLLYNAWRTLTFPRCSLTLSWNTMTRNKAMT